MHKKTITKTSIPSARPCILNQSPSSSKLHSLTKITTKWHSFVPIATINDVSFKKNVCRIKINTARTVNPSVQDSPTESHKAKLVPLKEVPKHNNNAPHITGCSRKHSKYHNMSSIDLNCQYKGRITLQEEKEETTTRNDIYVGNHQLMKDSSFQSQNESRKIKAYRDYKSSIFNFLNTSNSRPPLSADVKLHRNSSTKDTSLHIVDGNQTFTEDSLHKHVRTGSLFASQNTVVKFPLSRKKASQALRLSLKSHF